MVDKDVSQQFFKYYTQWNILNDTDKTELQEIIQSIDFFISYTKNAKSVHLKNYVNDKVRKLTKAITYLKEIKTETPDYIIGGELSRNNPLDIAIAIIHSFIDDINAIGLNDTDKKTHLEQNLKPLENILDLDIFGNFNKYDFHINEVFSDVIANEAKRPSIYNVSRLAIEMLNNFLEDKDERYRETSEAIVETISNNYGFKNIGKRKRSDDKDYKLLFYLQEDIKHLLYSPSSNNGQHETIYQDLNDNVKIADCYIPDMSRAILRRYYDYYYFY